MAQQSKQQKKAVVLLPTYNERDNIEKIITEVLDLEKQTPGWIIEILVADSNSPDGTLLFVKKIASKNPKIHTLEVGRGLGVALIEGHKYSLRNLNPDALVQIDADGQVEVKLIKDFLHYLDLGYGLVFGSRFMPGGKNELSLSRKIFTWGSCLYCKVMMGHWDVGEFTNSARAFTPEVFKKVNLSLVPWREQTFIIQPAFLHAAILTGAKYKEVPLVFKNRAEGYSKNKVINYTYDILTYGLDVRLKKWGINVGIFHLARRAKTFLKFGIVGVTGTLVDFFFYKFFINNFGLPPATSKGFSTELGIINNFTWNNSWTFKHRKTKTSSLHRFLIYNGVSLGALAIGVLTIKFLHSIYGDGTAKIIGIKFAYNTLYFLASIPPIVAWNFTLNHFVTWKHQKE